MRCFLCATETGPFIKFQQHLEIITLCENVLQCKSTASSKSSTAHLVRKHWKVMPSIEPERDHRSASCGDA